MKKSLFKIFYLKTVVPMKIAANHCNKMVFHVNGEISWEVLQHRTGHIRWRLQKLNIQSMEDMLTLLTVCAGGQQAGGAVRSWHHVCAGISGEVHGSVRLIARSDPGRNVLHAVRWVAGDVLTQVCVRDVIMMKVCWFFRYDHSRRSLQPAAGGFELLQKPFCSRVFHVFRSHPAHILGNAPQRH